MPKNGSARAAGDNRYANDGTEVAAREQAIVGTGIAIGLRRNTYGRIAPRSSLAVKQRLMTNAGVIGSDSRGEVKVILANLGDRAYRVEKGDRIAQLIIENSTTGNISKNNTRRLVRPVRLAHLAHITSIKNQDATTSSAHSGCT